MQKWYKIAVHLEKNYSSNVINKILLKSHKSFLYSNKQTIILSQLLDEHTLETFFPLNWNS